MQGYITIVTKQNTITFAKSAPRESFNQIEMIRKRPPMYIGSLNIEGVKNILHYFFNEVAKSSLHKTEITIECKKGNCISIEVQNIDTLLFASILLSLNDFYLDWALPVIVALSDDVHINLYNRQSLIVLKAKKGIFEYEISELLVRQNKIEINFKIDSEIFKGLKVNYEVLNQFVRKYAFIYTNFRIVSIDTTKDIKQINLFEYPNGLSEQLDYKIGEEKHGNIELRLDLTTKIDEFECQICFAYSDSWLTQTYIATYANCDEMIFGGSLENGIIDGIISVIKYLATRNKKLIQISYKEAKKQLILVAVVKGNMMNFQFGGSTRTRLEMPKLRKQLKQYVYQELSKYFEENKTIVDKLLIRFSKND